ncbi:MAG: hypothetical protein HQM09_15415 [Candidatus Riflebacteria bacterium]|nr:hypothetical protein [Candidatus Riflebacteria bacterium]
MKRILFSTLVAVLLVTGFVYAEKPARDVSGKRHPNLAAAQKFVQMAFEKISAAQKSNEFDMAGHAHKAKELLEQANNELKLAAEQANKENNEKKENKGKTQNQAPVNPGQGH